MMRYVSLFISVFFLFSCSSPVSTKEDSRTTMISFALPERGHVHVWVENAYQTKVKTLVNKLLPAGTHNLTLEMIDNKGNPLPYGVYSYYIKTEDHSLSRSLLFYANPDTSN